MTSEDKGKDNDKDQGKEIQKASQTAKAVAAIPKAKDIQSKFEAVLGDVSLSSSEAEGSEEEES